MKAHGGTVDAQSLAAAAALSKDNSSDVWPEAQVAAEAVKYDGGSAHQMGLAAGKVAMGCGASREEVASVRP